MNLNGLLIGVSCFILIGLFHPIVIYTEYRFGKQLWPIFAVFGSTCITISFFLKYLPLCLFLVFASFGVLKNFLNRKKEYRKVGIQKIRKNANILNITFALIYKLAITNRASCYFMLYFKY